MNAYTHSRPLGRYRVRELPQRPRSTVDVSLGRATRWVAKAGLVAVMVAVSAVLWVVSPLAWLWIASQVTDYAQPGLGPYILLFAGVLLTAVVLARVLGVVERAYQALAGTPRRRVHRSWAVASGQEQWERASGGPLGVIMAISVIVAIVALVTWILISGQPFEPIPMFG